MEVPKAVLAENPELANSYAYVSRALYGLGHAPRAWSQHLDKWFRSKGYVSLDADSCLYVLYDSTGHVQAAAATFVDDCVHVGTQASCAAYRAINANWRKFIDTGYNRSPDFGGYNRKTHCAHSGYNRWL